MLSNKYEYKYGTLYNKLHEIIRVWTNDTVIFKLGATAVRHNIRQTNPYKIYPIFDDVHQ